MNKRKNELQPILSGEVDSIIYNSAIPSLMIALILAAIILFASCYTPKNYDDENDFVVTVHGETVKIIGYRGRNLKINIPPRIQKRPVTAIGEQAFYNRYRDEIILPNTVVSIGAYAFGSNNLTSVIIPDSVKHIGRGAFANNRITEVVLPSHITEIEDWTFVENDITSITIPESVVTIGDYAFYHNRLTEIIIPKSVISIGGRAFSRNPHVDTYGDRRNDITKVTIGDNVKSSGSFQGFDSFYTWSVMKRGGTYIYVDHHWSPEDKNIPVYRFDPEYGWNSSDINFLLDMPDLENVVFRNNNVLTDITPLSELTNIKYMRMENCPNIESIKPLSSLINMESLYITHNDNYNYGDIATLQKLEHLMINGDNSGEIDLGSMGQMHYLKSLTLSAGRVKNINALQNLTSLEKLEISHNNNIFDLSWISNLHNLTELEMYRGIIDDISPLAALPNLARVDLSGNTIKDIKPLLRSNSLQYIRVFDDNVEGGIDDNTRLMFEQKNIYLDSFHGKE